MIYILTGDIRTGKTSALLDWIKSRTDVDGLLCPDNSDGKRYFLRIKNNEEFPLEVDKEIEGEVVAIGKFKFLKSSFKKANDYLISSLDENNLKYTIIDELGKLELKNEGLHEAAKRLIPKFIHNKKHHLIVVVRQSLVSDILQHYKIETYNVIDKQHLKDFR